jgi:hypothetical protein
VLAALPVLALLVASTAADARSLSKHAAAVACADKLHDYKPTVESVYGAHVGSNLFYLVDVKEKADGDISGESLYYASGIHFFQGTFTGKISGETIEVKGSKNAAKWSFSFTGTITCLLSQIKTAHMATDPPDKLPSTVQLTTICVLGPAFDIGDPAWGACEARQILDAIPQREGSGSVAIPHDGMIPYSWGGGHYWAKSEYGPATSTKPGPTTGTCLGYTGPGYSKDNSAKKNLDNCKNYKDGPTNTEGLDCSGFTRWVFYFVIRKDVLGSNNTSGQAHSKLLTKGADVAGDIVYFVKDGVYDHVGIVISPGEMIDEPKTGLTLRVDKITSGYGRAIYKAYIFPIVG